MNIRTERVEIPLAEGSFGAYVARPDDAQPRPAVLVFMEIFGINKHIRSVADRLAAEGYVAVAPDFFHRTGAGMELGYDQAGLEEGRKHLRALTEPQLREDIGAALSYLDGRTDVLTDCYGATGFCVGGHVAYLAATTGRLRACASFYGGGIAGKQGFGGGPSPLTRIAEIRGRFVGLFGAKDHLIPLDQVESLREALLSAKVEHELVVYEGASHGFFCELRESYEPKAAQDAWQRLTQLFADKLVSRARSQ